MIRTNRYYINVDDGSVVPWTSEIAENYKFKEITVKVAMAIERGEVSWQEVVRQIVAQITPQSLEEMISDKAKLNVRSADLKLEEQALQDGTQQSGEGNPFDIVLPENASEAEKAAAAKETAARRRAEAKARKEADAKAAKEAEERAVAALAGTDAPPTCGTEDMPAGGASETSPEERKANL